MAHALEGLVGQVSVPPRLPQPFQMVDETLDAVISVATERAEARLAAAREATRLERATTRVAPREGALGANSAVSVFDVGADGAHVYCGTKAGALVVADTAAGALVAAADVHSSEVRAVCVATVLVKGVHWHDGCVDAPSARASGRGPAGWKPHARERQRTRLHAADSPLRP